MPDSTPPFSDVTDVHIVILLSLLSGPVTDSWLRQGFSRLRRRSTHPRVDLHDALHLLTTRGFIEVASDEPRGVSTGRNVSYRITDLGQALLRARMPPFPGAPNTT